MSDAFGTVLKLVAPAQPEPLAQEHYNGQMEPMGVLTGSVAVPRDAVSAMLIEHLSIDLEEQETLLVEALRDRDGYQLLAKVSLERIATLTAENDRLRRRLQDVQGEMRERRATVVRASEAA